MSCIKLLPRLDAPRAYEALAGLNEYCGLTGINLVATDNNGDIERIELDAAETCGQFCQPRSESRA